MIRGEWWQGFPRLGKGRLGKVQLVSVCTDQALHSPDGTQSIPKEAIVYLGSTLHGNGKFVPEVARKIGAATADFNALTRVWRHAAISKSRKLQIFDAVIMSKLRYSVASACLLKRDLRRLDGFQANAIRRMLGIKPSFISRVSNARVLAMARSQTISSQCAKLQTDLLQKILSDPTKEELRRAPFKAGTDTPITRQFVMRVGRPRHNWATQVRLRQ